MPPTPMPTRCPGLLLCGLLLASATALGAQNPLYVDPVLGVDQPGGGGPVTPFKTLTYALTQVPSTSAGRIHLRPGTYSTLSGEVFPIAVPSQCTIESDPALVPAGARLAVLDTPYTAQSALELVTTSVRTTTLRNLRIQGRMLIGVELSVRATATLATLTIEDCEIAEQRPLEVNVLGNAKAVVTVLRSRLNGVDSPIAIHTRNVAGATAELQVERSVLIHGISAALVLDAKVAGTIRATLRATQVRSGVRYGLLAVSGNGGAIQTRLEHCLFHDHGNNVVGGGISNGAIFDRIEAGGLAPTHVVVNSIFAKNMTDAAAGANPSYTWGRNVVKQASLGNLGGNVVGAPTFAKAAENDFHLAPTSLGVDLGLAVDTTLADDFDGKPRLSAFAGAAPDLGPDEVFLGATFTSDGARVGQPFALRTSWSANAPFAFFLGTDAVPGSFGAGKVHLAGQIFATGMQGTCAASGVGEAVLTLPNDPALAGLIVHWQSVSAQAPYLGGNSKRSLVLLP